jgi:erythromycin esterase-like protein
MMELHLRLVRHLVEHHNFTTIVTETGFPESRIILEYVKGEKIGMDREEMYIKGLNQMYSAWEEGREMIEWIREYNRRHDTFDEEQKVHYYGVDIGGFYQDWKTPLEDVLGYLQRYVFTAEKAFIIMKLTKRFAPFLDAMAKDARKHYTDQMTREERADLALLLDDAVDLVASMESEYVQRSGRTEYEWARQSLLSMQLAENYYRNYLERRNPDSSKFVGLNGREIAMHRNVLWVLKQRPDSKIIWINHAVARAIPKPRLSIKINCGAFLPRQEQCFESQ